MGDGTHGLYPLVAYSVCLCECWVEVSGLVGDSTRGSVNFNFEAGFESPLMTCFFQGS